MGDEERGSGTHAGHDRPVVEDAGPIHVHALGVNPKDESLFIATHTGLFRASRPGAKPRRVADRWQDTMGFTVIGRDRFIASGHPDVPGPGAFLTWLGPRLVAVDRRGVVRVAVDGFGRWRVRGQVDGEPAALVSGPGRQLYVALHDGTIQHSIDGGVSWSVWRRPARRDRERVDRAGNDFAAPAEPQNPDDARDEPTGRSHKALRDVPGEPKER